jgi:hypothetical protein
VTPTATRGAAFVDRDDRRDARSDPALGLVDQSAQPLGIEALDDLAEEGDAGDVSGPAASALAAAAAERQRLLRFGQFALELAAFLDQRGDRPGTSSGEVLSAAAAP